MTPRSLEAVVRRAARRAFDIDDADVPFVWPRADQAGGRADASIALHEKLGFTEVGRMGRVGFKFGRWLGVVYLQKSIPSKKKRRKLFG